MVQIRVLGALQISGSPTDPAPSLLALAKPAAVLLYLVMHARGDFLRRDHLIGLFWPEQDTRSARGCLSQALHRIRRAVGDGAIEACGRDAVAAAKTIRCDAIEFDRMCDQGDLEEALGTYRGDLLPGFFIRGTPGFEDWLDRERTRLRSRALHAALSLSSSGSGQSSASARLSYARFATTVAGESDAAVCNLMHVLAETGDRVGAVQVYENFRLYLKREYSMTPASDTAALAHRLSSADAIHTEPKGRGNSLITNR